MMVTSDEVQQVAQHPSHSAGTNTWIELQEVHFWGVVSFWTVTFYS